MEFRVGLRRFGLFLGLLASSVLAACIPQEEFVFAKPVGPFVSGEKVVGSRIGAMKEPFRWPFDAYDPTRISEYKAGLKNKTFLAWDRGHGTQVEYLAADGRTFLWYPGNTVALAGTWDVASSTIPIVFGGSYQQAQLCYRYGSNTYNPVTGSRGGGPECTDLKDYKIVVEEYAPGDPFRLASGKVPFVLGKYSQSLDELYAQKAGR